MLRSCPWLELPDFERMPGFGDLSCVHAPSTLLSAPRLLANEEEMYRVWVDEFGHRPASFRLTQPVTGIGLGGLVELDTGCSSAPACPSAGHLCARSVTRTAMLHVDAKTERRPGLEAKGRH